MNPQTETKHTPAPWRVVTDAGTHLDHVAILDSDDYLVSGTCGHASDKRALANARLIAAAPDLLAALNAASHALKSYAYGNSAPDLAQGIAKVVDAAIAKATE